ncbi:MAG: glucosaminidase domain-containing protein [Flavipsychrobacter sp.]|nr:glucosaminidase domain-containing protein [Flavipsychrobacter sp.]
MQKWKIACAGMMILATSAYAQGGGYKERAAAYIEKHKMYAMAEQQRTGVPAAITLGQGILETEAGNSELATEANNHFGIKCKLSWKGETFAHTDDAPNECFRKYPSTYDSYKDHSDFLKQPRYSPLFRLPVTDYEGWAKGLKKFGYATNPRYAQQLIKIIEDNHLQDYTFAANNKDIIYPTEIVPEADAQPATGLASKPEPKNTQKPVASTSKPGEKKPNLKTKPAEEPVVEEKMQTITEAAEAKAATEAPEALAGEPGKLVRINGLRAIYALKGEVLLTYAIKNNVRYERLLEINEVPDAPLKENMYVLLDKKKTRGSKPSRTVGRGESLLQIAQAEGIQMQSLRELNKLDEGEEPMPGEVLSLQRVVSKKPQLVAKNTTLPPSAKNTPPDGRKPTYIEKKELEKNRREEEAKLAEQKARQEEEARAAAAKAREEEELKVAALKAEEERAATQKAEAEAALKAEEDAKVAALKAEEEAKAAAALKAQQEEEDRKIAIRTKAEKEAEEARLKAEEERQARQANRVVIKEEEATDEYSRLKSKLDKVVYASDAIDAQKAREAEEKMIADKIAAEEKKLADEKKAAEANKYYIVKKGDTAASIAKKNKLTMRQLMEWNNMDWAEVTPGQKLMVKQ